MSVSGSLATLTSRSPNAAALPESVPLPVRGTRRSVSSDSRVGGVVIEARYRSVRGYPMETDCPQWQIAEHRAQLLDLVVQSWC
jgi:hypothetical protein